MKKAIKNAKQKAGLFVDRLLPSSRSQSPAPADRDHHVASSAPLPPEQQAETSSQPGEITVVPVAIQQPPQIVSASQSTPLDGGPIPPTPSLDTPGHAADPHFAPAGSATSVGPDKILEMVRLASSSSPGPAAGLVSLQNGGYPVSC